MVNVAIRTARRNDGGPTHFPIVEGVLDGANTQPHVHNCNVRMIDGPRIHVFRVFFKRHRRLPANKCIAFMTPHLLPHVHGDMVVMRVAADGKGVVNFGMIDRVLADAMMVL